MVNIGEHPNRLISNRFIDPESEFNITGQSGDKLVDEYAVQIAVLVSLKQGTEILFDILIGYLLSRYVQTTQR